MDTIVGLLQAVGMTRNEAQSIPQYLQRCQTAFKIFIEVYIAQGKHAMMFPIARPQLIAATHTSTEIMQDRVLWVWAATWTLKHAIRADIIPNGYSLGICINCAMYTGCFCDDCDGPICSKCDDEFDENGNHMCYRCIHG